jgi:hypothetical protein
MRRRTKAAARPSPSQLAMPLVMHNDAAPSKGTVHMGCIKTLNLTVTALLLQANAVPYLFSCKGPDSTARRNLPQQHSHTPC